MHSQRGFAPLFVALVLLAVLASAAALATSTQTLERGRDLATERALAQAREALVSHAADRPVDRVVGPGYLPCPDLDNDGWAESTCGSLTGHLGQAQRLGRLPWKTLGLPDLRDGHGERLWYAVSTRHKGLLNCAASAPCIDMSPGVAVGTLTVRDGSGAVVHDGTLPQAGAGAGAAAVVLAPGPPITRASDGRPQQRDCAPGSCDARGRCIAEPATAAPACDPANYLDAAHDARFAFEDNARFHDRSDPAGRAANGDGFIQGPVALGGRVLVNDRIAVVAREDLMPRVMARVALETAACLRDAPPAPVPACGPGIAVGRVPGPALEAAGESCNARDAPDSWWSAWRPHVLLAGAAAAGLDLADEAGRVIATGRRFAIVVTAAPGDCAGALLRCAGHGCTRAVRALPSREAPHALVAVR